MFNLKPPNWYLKSTIGNIRLINKVNKKNENVPLSPEEELFQFWMEYFCDAIASDEDVSKQIRFAILVQETRERNRHYVPSNVIVNLGAEEKSIHIINVCLTC